MVYTTAAIAAFTVLLVLAIFRARKMNRETSRLDMHKSNLKKQSIEMVAKHTENNDQHEEEK